MPLAATNRTAWTDSVVSDSCFDHAATALPLGATATRASAATSPAVEICVAADQVPLLAA